MRWPATWAEVSWVRTWELTAAQTGGGGGGGVKISLRLGPVTQDPLTYAVELFNSLVSPSDAVSCEEALNPHYSSRCCPIKLTTIF